MRVMRTGSSIFHNNRIKTITSLPKNIDSRTFVIWESHKPNHQVGGCTVALWKEWIVESEQEDATIKEESMYVVNRRKRRGITVMRYR